MFRSNYPSSDFNRHHHLKVLIYLDGGVKHISWIINAAGPHIATHVIFSPRGFGHKSETPHCTGWILFVKERRPFESYLKGWLTQKSNLEQGEGRYLQVADRLHHHYMVTTIIVIIMESDGEWQEWQGGVTRWRFFICSIPTNLNVTQAAQWMWRWWWGYKVVVYL